MHKPSYFCLAILWLGLSHSAYGQACDDPVSWEDFLLYFFQAEEFTAGIDDDRCVFVPEYIQFDGLPFQIRPSFVAILEYEGEGAPGQIRVENGSETYLLNEDGGSVPIPRGTNKITIMPIRAGTATITIGQNQGNGFLFPRFIKEFTVLESNLPVTWTQPLVYTQSNETVTFTFSVADQRDVAGYFLERQAGKESEPVQPIAYIENGSDEVIYRTAIPAPATDGYYRIRQTDFDGTSSYSNTVSVPGSGDPSFRLFPNPADDYVQFANIPKQVDRIEIRSVTGRLVREIVTDDTLPDRIPVGELRAGVYLVSFLGGTDVRFTERLMVR
ncbi:T9SS type A sorting domain-containing protein [Lewinella sp. IMCC34191]|uniref:T9SS type A sorting domain-containing protein n=1 Tax=Lewinella sp. IMCC34191 TaxID=2259172 RepID=UPI00130090F2|nr:T9SS type A sorting domain-containing protein [Lewinella sp. IMCC34191]